MTRAGRVSQIISTQRASDNDDSDDTHTHTHTHGDVIRNIVTHREQCQSHVIVPCSSVDHVTSLTQKTQLTRVVTRNISRGSSRQPTTRLQSITDLKRRHTSLSQLLSRQKDHGASKPLNWCRKHHSHHRGQQRNHLPVSETVRGSAALWALKIIVVMSIFSTVLPTWHNSATFTRFMK